MNPVDPSDQGSVPIWHLASLDFKSFLEVLRIDDDRDSAFSFLLGKCD